MRDFVPELAGLRDIIDAYDLLICDLWGVMHNGVSLHAPAVEALLQARALNVDSVFLSNAPRTRQYVRSHLAQMGMDPTLLGAVVTSGGLARDRVRETYQGAALYHMGPASDHGTLEGLPVDIVSSPDEADVILATGLDFETAEEHEVFLQNARARNVPFLCANPDRVVHVGSILCLCAGVVADLYQNMGGPVEWFGKPSTPAFLAAVEESGQGSRPGKERVLVIGDSLHTDMTGAAGAGFDGLFITGGIHRDGIDRHKNATRGLDKAWFDARAHESYPAAVMPALVW